MAQLDLMTCDEKLWKHDGNMGHDDVMAERYGEMLEMMKA